MALDRTIFGEDHEQFRRVVRRFIAAEIPPHYQAWDDAGLVAHEVWLKAGAAGLLCPTIPEAYGGAGASRLFSAIVIEEIHRSGCLGVFVSLHSDIVAPYIVEYGDEAQKERFLPGMVSGERVGAVAMTEPACGSDLKAITTTARRDGDHSVPAALDHGVWPKRPSSFPTVARERGR